MEVREPALRVVGLSKSFGPSRALSDVTFDVTPGGVHALVGENGAGKSTLVKIITGILQADEGEFLIAGERMRFSTPIEARRAGVAAVYQDPKLFPHLDVAENIAMGDEPVSPLGTVDRNALYDRARRALSHVGVGIDPRALVGGLSVAELQFVEIARALTADLRLLILDEPTSALTPAEAEKLFRIVRVLRDKGTAVMLITHRLEEVEAIADTSRCFATARTSPRARCRRSTRTDLVQMMVGRPARGAFRQAGPARRRQGAFPGGRPLAGRRVPRRLVLAARRRDRRDGRAGRSRAFGDRADLLRHDAARLAAGSSSKA